MDPLACWAIGSSTTHLARTGVGGASDALRAREEDDLLAFSRLDRLGLPRTWLGLRACLRRSIGLRACVRGHRSPHERLERARVDLLPFVDVDRPSRLAFQAGIEEARWVWDAGPPGERELHDLRVRFPGADNPVVRPDRSAHPLPLLGHFRIGFQDQRPHAGQRLPAPSPELADALI